MDVNSEADMEELARNDEFLGIFSSCGDTSLLKVSKLV